MVKNFTSLRYLSIVVAVIIVLASVPSVVARQTDHLPELAPELKEQIINKLQQNGNGHTLDWEPWQFFTIFLIVVGLFIDFIVNEGWFPGLTFVMIYLFVLFCILSLA